MKKEAEIFPFYIAWFGLGLPIFLLMILLGGGTSFYFEQVGVVFMITILIVSLLIYLYFNKNIGLKKLIKGGGVILLTGIFLGPTLVVIYLLYLLFF